MAACDFQVSTETLEPSDPRDALLAAIDADCKRIREMCWALRPVSDKFLDLRAQAKNAAAIGEPFDVDALLAAQRDFTIAEKDLNILVESVERRVHDWNCGKLPTERIYVAHTAEGLPIRTDKTRKTMLFD